jgi:hypothetical protein
VVRPSGWHCVTPVPTQPAAQTTQEIDPFLAKIEELVERSGGKIRVDVVHRLAAMSLRRLAALDPPRGRGAQGRLEGQPRRRYRPWIPEPGMWLQFDWGCVAVMAA